MKSQHGDKFNHDDEAVAYDEHVLKEEIPYRTGYQDVLEWVAGQINQHGCHRVLDLGIGTGNLATRVQAQEIVGVDNSGKMLVIAREKLGGRTYELIQIDLLQYFESASRPFDGIMSTYALHHLEPDEKESLFRACHTLLEPGGIMVFGDLMFRTMEDQRTINAQYRAQGMHEMVNEAEQEFYWIHDQDLPILEELGYAVTLKQFSTLAWGLAVS